MTCSSIGPLGQVSTGLLFFLVMYGATGAVYWAGETKVDVKFSGGHDIGKDDFGRPVALIAAGLDVDPDVFREAFGGVTPAKGRGPTGGEARKNKEALLKVLAPHGVTNERLDEVSDYYRFRPQNDELWPTSDAKAHAIVENGEIKRIVVTEPGSGYCSEPKVSVPGFAKQKFQVTLKFSKKLKQNGGISAIEPVTAKAAKAAAPAKKK